MQQATSQGTATGTESTTATEQAIIRGTLDTHQSNGNPGAGATPATDTAYDEADWESTFAEHEAEDAAGSAAAKQPAPTGASKKTADHKRSVEPAEYVEPYLVTVRADTVPVKRIEWLLPKRIPFGGLTLFDGPGGVGKSTFLGGIIAGASNGRDFFTGEAITPRSSLIVGVEDVRALTAARLRLYGADMERVHFVDSANVGGRNVPLTLPEHIGILETEIVKLDIGFIYIDALFSHLSLEGEGKMAQQVRRSLRPIGEMLERHRFLAFAAVRHWTKGANAARDRANGSIEFTNFARQTLAFGRHPANDDLIVCTPEKNNWTKQAGAVAFRLAGHDALDDDKLPWEVSIAESVGPCEGITADDLAMHVPGQQPTRKRPSVTLDETIAYLESALLAGPRLTAEIEAEIREHGASEATFRRARKELGIVSDRVGGVAGKGAWQLSLPEPDAKALTKNAKGLIREPDEPLSENLDIAMEIPKALTTNRNEHLSETDERLSKDEAPEADLLAYAATKIQAAAANGSQAPI